MLSFLFLGFSSFGQNCENVNTFEDETPGILLPYSGAPGYFGDYGSPQILDEGCPVGALSLGVRMKASVDGNIGDGVGYTETGGIDPQPTFLSGQTYHVSGKKLYSNISMGSYTDIIMSIRLSNLTNNGLDCNAPDCEVIIEKSLMLTPGVCESWDPPFEFVSPEDFDYMIISVAANSVNGEDDLYIVIDDWCVEPIGDMACEPELQLIQEDCGKVQFTNLSESGTVVQWNVQGPNGLSFMYDEENPCEFYSVGGAYSVTLTIQCEDGQQVTSEQFFFEIEENLPPFFENCPEGQIIEVLGSFSEGECIGEFIFPELFAFDDGNPITPTCTFDGVAAVNNQVFIRPAGTYDVVCTIVDDCNEPQICFFQVEILCDSIPPCEYTCCEEGPNWPVEDFSLGSLPSSNPAGYFPVYGDPQVINDGCDGSIQGVELKGVTQLYDGDALGIREGGFIQTDTIFKLGNSYCISFCMKVTGGVGLNTVLDLQASTSSQTDNSCSGSCEIIGSSDIVSNTDGWTQQQLIYTPSADFEHLIMLNNNSGVLDLPPSIVIDNVCISIAEQVTCGADIVVEDQGCGKMIVTADTCGEVDSLNWQWEDGFQSYESSDTSICHEFPHIGPWTVTLTVFCVDGTTNVVTKTFTTSGDTIAPSLVCPNDTIINIDPELECLQDFAVGNFTIDDPTATVTCYQSGFPIADPTIPIVLQEGLTEIKYIAQDTCGNVDSCSFTITLNCDPIPDPKYDCPIDVLFIMDNSGSIDGTEYTNMSNSALNEMSSISSVYPNSKFGVVHYSGGCGNEISIEHDFSTATSIATINRQFSTIYPGIMDDLNESLDAVINALNSVPDSDIKSSSITSLSPDPLAELYIVIFTDGQGASSSFPGGCTNSALLPYTNANILKNSYNANISVVHFVPTYADAQCAAIASQGGTWTGAVDSNPGDPSNSIVPRQYIPATFSAPVIDLLSVLPPCEPCFDCDDLDISVTATNADSCCYSVDIVNGIGPEIVKLEAEIISPDWQFNTSSANPGTGYQWYSGSIPTSNKLCVSGTGDVLPLGTHTNVLDYCFSEATASPSGPQIVVFKWYSLLNDTLFELQCTDTITTECIPVLDDPCLTVDEIDIDCNEANAYEYIVNLSVTNTSGFNASHITLNGLNPGFQFANCIGGVGVNSISIPIPGGLANGVTTNQCVKIIAPYPILTPEQICFDIGIYSFFECCHLPEQVCVTLDPCCDPCEDISTSVSPIGGIDEDQCCYTLEIDYGCDYRYFNKVKVSSITSGVTFGYHALGNSQWQMCGSSATELCVEPISGTILKGNYTNLLDICFDEITSTSQVPQVVKIDYITIDPATNLDTVACSDELMFECDIVDNKCLEVSDQDLVCVPDSSKYQYTFTITNKSTIAFNATDVDVFIFSPSDLYFDPSGGTFPFTSPLGFNQSETITTCIKSTSSFPSTATDIILGYRLRFNAGDTCCYESVYDTLPLPPCGTEPCCEDEENFNSLISQGFQITDLGDCTYQVCANQFDTCHWFGTLGPDWGDGTGTLPSIVQSDAPNNCWTHTYTQQGPHKVTIHVYEGDLPNDDVCWDADLCSTIENNCPIDTNDCLTVVDVQLKGIQCDTLDCYENPFCQSWLVDVIADLGCFGIAASSVEKAFYNGQPVFVSKTAFYDFTETNIYTCDGTLLQSCYWTVPPPATPCNPDAGIDILTDLSNVVQIWDCNDPLPVYDPIACVGTGNTIVDYCIKVMNNGSDPADKVDLNVLAPSGVLVTPGSIPISIPPSSMETINFSISGTLFAGDVVKIEAIMSGLDPNEMEYECRDTICVEVPPCPIEDCCEDEDEFNANLAQGFTVTQLGDCTYQVCANQFDTCHWFSNPAPDWGDGGVNLQVLTQSNPPNNCWTYTYSQSGTYVISLGVSEINFDTGEECWSGGIFATVEPNCCEDEPCENVMITADPISTVEDSCCYSFTIENNFCDDYFKGIRVEVVPPATISQIQGLNGFAINQLSTTVAEVKPFAGFIQQGAIEAFTLCNTNYDTNPHIVSVSWLIPGPNGTCEAICTDEFEIGCDFEPPFDEKCFELLEDSIHCESNTYCFKIKNVSQPAFDINSVHLYDLTSSLTFTPSGRFDIPTLASGNSSDWICVQYSGVNPGDNVCYKLSAHNTPANLPPTTCCTDTIETCFTIPECNTETCALCPDNTTMGTNMIQNGDFEAGYAGGWYSNYDLLTTGLMGSNEYSVRNSTNLVNGQWDALDHTANSPTGNFLVLDGPSGNVAFGVPVTVQPNTNYVFCMWVDNLVKTSTSSAPVIRVDVGTTNILAGQLLPKTPDGWQLITLNYFSGPVSGVVDIRIRDISTSNYNDWAIDDISFVECAPIVTDCCSEIDTMQICDYYDANISLSREGCEGCVFIDLDSCDIATVDFGNGPVSIQDNVPVCNDFDGNGNYTFIVNIQRLGADGNVCFEKDFPIEILIEECPPISVGNCISLIDGELDCINGNYCFRVVNNTNNLGFSFASIALINESIGHSFSPDPISLGGDVFPGDTSSLICVTYSGAINGDELCFDLVAHKEDLAAGEEPTFCCADTTRYCFVLDCPTTDPCCEMSQEELCDYLELGTVFDVNECELCLPFEEDSCMVIRIDYGDGFVSESTGGGDKCHMYEMSGTYSVNILLERLNSEGSICIEKDTVFEIDISECPTSEPCDINDLIIYNAITPNNDGLNDALLLEGADTCPRDIKIYNRWGQLVWSESNYTNGWIGQSFSGKKLPNGTYFLIVEMPNVDSKEKRMIQTFIDIRDN